MLDEPVTVESRNGKHPGQRVVTLKGKLSFETPAEDRRFVEQVLGEPAAIVILDLSGVSACYSSGIGELMKVHGECKRQNRRLALAATREKVKAILKVARVLEYFNVYATVEEAEAALI